MWLARVSIELHFALGVVERARDFATALFDVEALDHSVELLGPQDLEGQSVLAIELHKLLRGQAGDETTTYGAGAIP